MTMPTKRKGKRALQASRAFAHAEEKPGPPDWGHGSTTTGGNGWTAEMVRHYPTPDGIKLPVRVSFSTWEGVVPGAVHTNAVIEPDRNPVWDGTTWCNFWDDPQKDEEKSFRESFRSAARAVRWAVRKLHDHFPEESYSHRWKDLEGEDAPVPTVEPDPEEDAAIVECGICNQPVGEHAHEARVRELCATIASTKDDVIEWVDPE